MKQMIKKSLEYLAQEDKPKIEISPFALALIAFTVLTFAAAYCIIDYVFGQVVATIASVEEENTTAIIITEAPISDAPPAYTDDDTTDPSTGLLKTNTPFAVPVEVNADELSHSTPITARLRTATRHLRAVGGRAAPFRGIGLAVVIGLLGGSAAGMPTRLTSTLFSTMVSIIILAPLQMTWVHIVISQPSKLTWFRRVPSFKKCLKVYIPAALASVALFAAAAIPVLVGRAVGFLNTFNMNLDHMQQEIGERPALFAAKWLAFTVSGLAAWILIAVPTTIALNRVYASLLPVGAEPIVAFDRTFGGRIELDNVTGPGTAPISLFQAWKSLNVKATARVAKVYVKVLLIQLFLAIVAGVVIGTQLAVFVMPKIQEAMDRNGGASGWEVQQLKL